MNFGLKLRLTEAVKKDRLNVFLTEITPAEHIDIMRNIDDVLDPVLRAVDASSMYERYTIYTDVLKMSLSQFINLEYALQGDFDEALIASIIIRPKDELEFDNTNQEIDEQNLQNILEEPAASVLYIIKSMMHSRDYVVFTKFEGVLYSKIEPEEGEENEEPLPEDEFTKRWFWYAIVRNLANEDLQKFQFVYDMKMSDVLVELAYRVQLQKKIDSERRAEEARMR